MSTRSQIGFFENENNEIKTAEVYIYRHSDGYPESEHGVLNSLVPFALSFNEEIGLANTSHATAQCVADQINKPGYRNFTGFGIDAAMNGNGLHGDIEYFYHVSPTKIKVYKARKSDCKTWPIVAVVELPKHKGEQPFVRIVETE